ncbi:hypothetical protein PtA15_12A512 [Puccinia triticina]|uniref:Uncharacterized protein n=1 Tax=Puccinia triticina TaxID=208348 RepID=A0ABY7D6G6_9BASI|nr:uncharacterized protein PtA15_12A512 [Puccinia triticina]WAQ90522.1 hypothetical protein PtA15_12A512 [Puccinia triticina]
MWSTPSSLFLSGAHQSTVPSAAVERSARSEVSFQPTISSIAVPDAPAASPRDLATDASAPLRRHSKRTFDDLCIHAKEPHICEECIGTAGSSQASERMNSGRANSGEYHLTDADRLAFSLAFENEDDELRAEADKKIAHELSESWNRPQPERAQSEHDPQLAAALALSLGKVPGSEGFGPSDYAPVHIPNQDTLAGAPSTSAGSVGPMNGQPSTYYDDDEDNKVLQEILAESIRLENQRLQEAERRAQEAERRAQEAKRRARGKQPYGPISGPTNLQAFEEPSDNLPPSAGPLIPRRRRTVRFRDEVDVPSEAAQGRTPPQQHTIPSGPPQQYTTASGPPQQWSPSSGGSGAAIPGSYYNGRPPRSGGREETYPATPAEYQGIGRPSRESQATMQNRYSDRRQPSTQSADGMTSQIRNSMMEAVRPYGLIWIKNKAESAFAIALPIAIFCLYVWHYLK